MQKIQRNALVAAQLAGGSSKGSSSVDSTTTVDVTVNPAS